MTVPSGAFADLFWDLTSRSNPLSGDDMERLLRRSLEENAFSSAGLGIRKARHAARLLQAQAEAPRRGTEESGLLPSALAFAEDELIEKERGAVALLRDIVQGMGLVVAAPSVDPPRAAADSWAVTGTQDVPAPQHALGDASTTATELPSLALPSPSPSRPTPQPPVPLRATAAPKSALAILVAKAKAKHHGDEGAAAATAAPLRKAHPQASGVETASSGTPAHKRPRAHEETSHNSRATAGSHEEDEDEGSFAVQLPPGVLSAMQVPASASPADGTPASTAASAEAAAAAKHPSQMTREEFLSQYKRAPRRGEVGQSAEEIAKAQQLGYVMSGSRSIGAQMYVDRIQRQLHEREAGKLQQQFRKVEDDRMDDQMIQGLLRVLEDKVHHKKVQ